MNTASQEFAVRSNVGVQDERERGRPCEWESVEGEVAERVRDQPVLINFHPTDDVRAVSDQQVCASIYDGVREGAQVAARRSQISFRSTRNVLRHSALSSAVKRDDDDIDLARLLRYDT